MQTKLSRPQRAVLEWLLAYPGVELSHYPFGRDISWTAYWQNAEARAHMVGVFRALGSDVSFTAPRVIDLDGPTPRITYPTFGALMRGGYLRETTRYTSGLTRFTISKRGILAIRQLPQEGE